jgi:nitrite reductase (NO-forming)
MRKDNPAIFPLIDLAQRTISLNQIIFICNNPARNIDFYRRLMFNLRFIYLLVIAAIALTGCAPAAQTGAIIGDNVASSQTESMVSFTLTTGMEAGKMVFIGVGGDIDGVVNPDLQVNPGASVEIRLINGDGVMHDVALPDFDAASDQITDKGSETVLVFTTSADQNGEYAYFCTLPGHRVAGMEGRLIVGEVDASAQQPQAADISRDPADLPAPIGNRGPQTIQLDLETVELEGALADGTTYTYWTFNGTVPGPFIRVRVGDTVEVSLKNADSSIMPHSVDFHAVTGPGGGAAVTQTLPGGITTFTFKALNPGLYVYHCATPMVAEHIANGMYGLILVEPEGGLPPVDREFYVMQGELYTTESFGSTGHLTGDIDKLLDEQPEYYIFNGAAGALTEAHPLHANVGETVRIYFGVGGPNKTSSFHVIGEIFDRVFDQASLTAPPLTDVQTTLVPAGGAAVVEFTLDVPGRYILVDHSLSRMERGLAGYLVVEGEPNTEVFEGEIQPNSGH